MRRHALALVLTLAALTAIVPAATPAFAAGNNLGTNLDCSPGPPTVITQFNTPQQITGSGDLHCQEPGSETQFGAPGDGPTTPPAPPQPGTPCHFRFETRVLFRLNNGVPEINAQIPAPPGIGHNSTMDPLNPNFAWQGWLPVVDWGGGIGAPPPVATANSTLYDMAGTTDFFYAWTFDGTWTLVGGQLKCKADPNLFGDGWNTTCTAASDLATSCLDPAGPATPPVSGPMPIAGLNIDLTAFLRGRFFGGNITSRPDAPHPGLTNIATCFYVTGMTVDGKPADPNQDVTWEVIKEGPDVGEGRHVYFTFMIDVHRDSTELDFGDGSQPAQIGNSAGSPEPVPPQCVNVADQAFLVAHTYTHYSTGAGFPVRITSRYTADVTEFWRDADGLHVQPFPGAATLGVPSQPAPFTMPIVQEEGVPIKL
jgi:hypothetical protein